jgi:hypothetical protein
VARLARLLRLFRIRNKPLPAPRRPAPLVYTLPVRQSGPSTPLCAGCRRAKAYRLPFHHSFIDGRSAHDWHRSVADYLKWRAGSSWRPARHSGACVSDGYRDALHLVTQAFHSLSPRVELRGGAELKSVQQRRSHVVSIPHSQEVA